MVSTMLDSMSNFWEDEEGLGTLEMILIIAVLIAVVLLFKDKIQEVVEALIKTAGEKSQEVFD
ncbi:MULTISPECIES: Flp1 family type IVb pilin [unclassified Paenibacillus]|uniref:Flp1 family type IVb pilin n=1 Tax=unclassified Paenibacillus TaxID=185978 RepID=UPI000F9CAE39|nr:MULTISPECIES: Flp1 family type IVb pilin [unclassified Paenibacillus]MDH6425594.1 Flp pilus assembly pilin Flp [Paenibacillus sp. PastH-4]MDH6441614.1 Flp pilus assembly pilin Flp [Paenibacillus sp. PastF-4]MDH6529875.1 Flp pilus assembly pilin Flp [Paenibacillus sp. PastH-3]